MTSEIRHQGQRRVEGHERQDEDQG
jgi:hypothetical protein